MNKSPESPILSDEHYKFLQLDQVKRDDKSLREFNAELLQRIGDYRKKNLEFSAAENALKTELAAQAKRFADRERELATKFQREFEQLKKQIEDDQITNEQSVEEWNRKLAKLSDESWAKGLELESLRRTDTENQEKIAKLQEQVARTLANEATQRGELESALESEEALRLQVEELKSQVETLKNTLEQEKKSAAESQLVLKSQVERAHAGESALRAQTVEATQLIAGLQEALEQQKRDSQAALATAQGQQVQLAETFRTREAELITAFEALRTEYSNIDNCYRESNETITQIRAELRMREEEHQARLIEQEQSLRAAYVIESQDITSENTKLREMLSVRETRLDADRAALQTWREQLGYLDQHLRQLSDSMKKDKADVLRTAKAVAEEVQFSLTHPFTEYLEIAEKEFAHIESQLANTSSMSPLRAKLEARLGAARSHRDGILEILEQAKTGLSEHAKTIQTILKNLEAAAL